ncbi:porin family protein [Parabacteroides bouchesdurhonensis]|uniref:porin family protein n=1 Tax=Parabacteroides bouchesdurhonensis TaxID=1936995 RepID=UPI000C8374D6|nr:porin family protein [Parabacteroides bouchesdurhonensis]RHJ91106.1 PorT family protein [Bacteroides sp. AM07-16]
MKKHIFLICVLALFTVSAMAQVERNMGIIKSSLIGLEYEVKAGFNIGGTSPLPLPREIRSIDGYKPTLCVAIEGDVTKWFGVERKWGMTLGFRVENKGMETKATVKNYSMEIIGSGGEKLKGNWTGGVQTKVRNAYLSIPVLASYKLSKRVNISAGPYVSFMPNGDFSGYVYDGYLREINPTGTKVEFQGDNRASYDFSDNLRTFQWGVQAGVSWRAFNHLNVHADLTWGLNDMFEKDFDTITFAMYPIYLNVGFGYAF